MTIAIISAMKEELDALVNNYDVNKVDVINDQDVYEYKTSNNCFYFLTCKIGKVNATITTFELLNKYNIELVINIGTSGGLHNDLQVGDVVISNKLAFHDVDVTAFDYEIGQYPGEERFYSVKSNEILDNIFSKLFSNVHKGLVVTGDQFINSHKQKENIINKFNDVYAVEMESAAIVKTCLYKNVDCYVARTISDLAHEKASIDFDEYLEEVCKKFVMLVKEIDEQ